MLLFVHHLFQNHSLTPSLYIPSIDIIFLSKSYLVAEDHVYKHCGDVYNDVILMLQFLEVVWQHVLGVMGNIITLICCKFNSFSSSEKNLKIGLRFDEIIVTIGWRVFWDTV